jgi:hypothetical protein
VGLSVEEYKRTIIEMIDENRNSWVKAAFYGDPDVAPLLDELYRRWEEANREGEVLDYATFEELRMLASKARHYGRMSNSQAMNIALRRMMK